LPSFAPEGDLFLGSKAGRVYRFLELFVEVMVGVILVCFVLNLALAAPDLSEVVSGFVPNLPEGVTFDGAKFRTPLIASFLAGLRGFEGAETRMASPTSPSSSFSGWITRIGVPKGRLQEAA